MAFDCHWILINEVSIEEIMYGSGFDLFCVCEIVLGTSASDGQCCSGVLEKRKPLKLSRPFSLATFSTSDQNLKLPLM